jgi:hypothetical protein
MEIIREVPVEVNVFRRAEDGVVRISSNYGRYIDKNKQTRK